MVVTLSLWECVHLDQSLLPAYMQPPPPCALPQLTVHVSSLSSEEWILLKISSGSDLAIQLSDGLKGRYDV